LLVVMVHPQDLHLVVAVVVAVVALVSRVQDQ
jgi:hypothetical protein